MEVCTHASAKAFGARLLQKHAAAKHLHPIAYYSRKVNNALKHYLSTDYKMLAIVEALQHW